MEENTDKYKNIRDSVISWCICGLIAGGIYLYTQVEILKNDKENTRKDMARIEGKLDTLIMATFKKE